MAIRRIRRAAGSGGVDSNAPAASTSRPERRGGGMMARGDGDDDDDDASRAKKLRPLRPWGTTRTTNAPAGGPSAAGGGGDEPPPPESLSEKLRRQELLEQQQREQQQREQQQREQENQGKQNRGRGPLLDSDHSRRKLPQKSGPPEGSIESGWSRASSSRGTNNNNTIRGKMMTGSADGGGGNKFSIARVASSLPSPFRNSKRSMSMVRRAFGEEGRIKQKVMSVVNCAKKGEESQFFEEEDGWGNDDLPDDSYRGRARMVKFGLVVLLVFLGVFQFGRRRGRRAGASGYGGLQFGSSSSSLSMSDQYLRGILPSSDGAFGGRIKGRGGGAGEKRPPPGDDVIVHHAAFPPHLSHLSNLTSPYDPAAETPYFWDVHLSGESVAEVVFSRCHRLAQAAEFGLRQPDYDEDKLVLFELDGTQYVNVDTTTQEGVQRASHLGLASSGLADVIISPHFHMMASQIFSLGSPGRMFALFRHPVDRSLSMYYYLAKASWDPQYNPKLSKMTIEQYAKSRYIENNWLTRFLVGKPGGRLSHADMLLAKKIVKFKCLVGLYEDIEVSMARFQRYFGWNSGDPSPEQKAEVAQCRSKAVLQGDKNVKHPTVREGSVAWNAIARMNVYDMELYEYARRIYTVQGEQIFDVVGHEVLASARGSAEGGDVAPDSADREAAPGPGKSMAADSFEDEVLGARSGDAMKFESEKDEEPASARPGKSMVAETFGDALFDPGSDSMTLDVEVKGNSAAHLDRSGGMADAGEDETGNDPEQLQISRY